MNIKQIILVLIFFSFTTMAHAGRIENAVKKGNLEELKSLLADKRPVPFTKEGESMLHLAFRYNHTDIVQFFIDLGLLNDSSIQEEFFGPIGRPRKIGSPRIAKKDPTAEFIQKAVMKGERRTVEELLERRLDLIKVRTDEGESLLHLAARYECHEIAQELLARGALCYEVDRLFQPCRCEDEEEEPENLFNLQIAKTPVYSLNLSLSEKQSAVATALYNIKVTDGKSEKTIKQIVSNDHSSLIYCVMGPGPRPF